MLDDYYFTFLRLTLPIRHPLNSLSNSTELSSSSANPSCIISPLRTSDTYHTADSGIVLLFELYSTNDVKLIFSFKTLYYFK